MIFCKHKMSRQGLQDRTDDICKKYGNYCKHNVNVIFDIGANVGLYSMFFYKHFESAKIFSFEPVNSNYVLLSKHVKMNALSDRIFPKNFGFWSVNKSIRMGYPPKRERKNTGLFSIFGNKWSESCEVKNMDEWAQSTNVYPDLIKIDTEGSELTILESSQKCLSTARYIAWENNPYYADQNKGLEDLLSELGFLKVESMSWKMDEFWEKK